MGAPAAAISAALLALALPGGISGQTITVLADPPPLVISSVPVAGATPEPVEDNSTTYTVALITAKSKITAEVDQELPDGLTLEINLAAPEGAVSLGFVTLEIGAKEVVTGIGATELGIERPITYRFSATLAAGPIELTRTVTLTLLEETGS